MTPAIPRKTKQLVTASGFALEDSLESCVAVIPQGIHLHPPARRCPFSPLFWNRVPPLNLSKPKKTNRVPLSNLSNLEDLAGRFRAFELVGSLSDTNSTRSNQTSRATWGAFPFCGLRRADAEVKKTALVC